MMQLRQLRQGGFTIVEMLTVVAVITVLGAIALVGYQKYTERSRGVDIIEKYDAIRTSVQVRAQQGASDDCAALASGFDTTNLVSAAASLGYGFEAVTGGYRPVLTVCAQAGQNGTQGVGTARGAYETLQKTGVVEKNPVLTESAVSFALRLTDGDAALCKNAPAQPATTCGQSQPVAQPANPPSQAAQSSTPAPIPASIPACPSGQFKNAAGACVAPPDPAALVAGLTPEQKALLDSQPPDPVEQFQPGFTVASAPPPPLALKPGPNANDGLCPYNPVANDPVNGDSYGPTCPSDFGGMCDACYIRDMCQVYCGIFVPSPEVQRSLMARRIAAMQVLCNRNPDDRYPPGHRMHTEYCAYTRHLMAQQ